MLKLEDVLAYFSKPSRVFLTNSEFIEDGSKCP